MSVPDVTFIAPPGYTRSPFALSHPRVQIVSMQPVTTQIRRDILKRYAEERTQHGSCRAFAKVTSVRLAQQGVYWSSEAIEVMLSRGRVKDTCGERLVRRMRQVNLRTRDRWFDFGDLCHGVGLKSRAHFNTMLHRLRRQGLTVERCATSAVDRRERGWFWQYRLMEAQG